MAVDTSPRHVAASIPDIVAALVARARVAQAAIADYTQAQTNTVVTAVAWACYRTDRAEALARLAIEDTGLGRYEDKVIKNKRKTFGTLRDLLDPAAVSVGIIDDDPATGLQRIAKPVGVVAALCPSTNPSATPVNKTMMALKGRNPVILAPSPKGASTCAKVIEYMHAELDRIGAPRDLVQMLPAPISKELTNALMRAADLVVVTGSQGNVRAAYSSGTPAIGVGAGNVPVIVDASADLADAAAKIARSKTFDYATSCSSENSLVIVDAVYDATIDALRREGGYLLDGTQTAQLRDALFLPNGKLSERVIAQAPRRIAEEAGFSDPAAHEAAFFLIEDDGVGDDHPFSGEKLCVALTLYRARDFAAAAERVQEILDYAGAGHSCGIHTADAAHAQHLADRMRVVRVLVNQAHCFNNGGGFDNGLNFTLSMGCGTWAGNSISENLSYRHFLNVTHLVRTTALREPSEDELFGAYVNGYGA
ncbi:MAG: aldehyde dehydrogenase family protein [Vulcanimicrobiaceae bacterium]